VVSIHDVLYTAHAPHSETVSPAFPASGGGGKQTTVGDMVYFVQLFASHWRPSFSSNGRMGMDTSRHSALRTWSVPIKWMKFGLRVGLAMNWLESWEEQYNKNASRCWLKVIGHWLANDGTEHYPAMWEGLYTLVRDCDFPQVALSFLKALEHCQP
jgi:hypothetical protein